MSESGFLELEHTADWALRVWAPDLEALLKQAARGMYALSGIVLGEGPRQKRDLRILAADKETLLVDFLTELLYLAERENLAFDDFSFDMGTGELDVQLSGAQIERQEKEIKAVTYHNLDIHYKGAGLEADLVFDV